MITVRIPEPFGKGGDALLSIDDPIDTLSDLLDLLGRRLPGVAEAHSFSVNGSLIVNGERFVALADGDEVEILS
jgi:molybdopterin converting factor small subunit